MASFDKYGNLIVEDTTTVTRDKRRIVTQIRVTDVTGENPLLIFEQVDQVRLNGEAILTTQAPDLNVYYNDISEDIDLGVGKRSITADQLRYALTRVWAVRAQGAP